MNQALTPPVSIHDTGISSDFQRIPGLRPVAENCSLFDLQSAFAESCEPTLGAELEWGITDPNTGRPQALYERLRAELPDQWLPQFQQEFLRCQIEYASRSHPTIAGLSREVASFYSTATIAARSLNTELSWIANFPNWEFQPAMVTQRPRTQANLARLGANARHLATNSLHLHVAVPKSKAIAVIDGLQGFIPLFVALSANSPIHERHISAYKSHRVSVWASQFAVCGLSNPYGCWQNFERRIRQLVDSGRIASAKDLYYFVRPTRYGTIELRCCDIPANLNQAIALAGLYQTIVVGLCEGTISCRRDIDILRAELHEAYTHGIQASLTSHTGRLGSPLQWLEQIVRELKPIAVGLKTDAVLSLATSILQDNGAEQQLRDFHANPRSSVSQIKKLPSLGRYGGLAAASVVASVAAAARLMGY